MISVEEKSPGDLPLESLRSGLRNPAGFVQTGHLSFGTTSARRWLEPLLLLRYEQRIQYAVYRAASDGRLGVMNQLSDAKSAANSSV